MCAKDYGGKLIDGRQWVIKPYRCPYEGDCFYIADAKAGAGSTVDHIGLSGNWEKWTTTLKLFYSRDAAEWFAKEVAGREA